MNRHIVATRESLCRKCPTPCDPRPSVLDPCAACPIRRWPAFGCATNPLPLPPPKAGLSPLLRRLRSYRKAGYLVGFLDFMRRRAACSKCDRRRTLPTHPGLYGCGSCSTCTGGPERMLTTQSICPSNRWNDAIS